MTILLTQAIQVAGVTQPAGTTLTLEAGLEADLVTRKCATFVSRPDQGITAEVFARTEPLTGRIGGLTAGAVGYDSAWRPGNSVWTFDELLPRHVPIFMPDQLSLGAISTGNGNVVVSYDTSVKEFGAGSMKIAVSAAVGSDCTFRVPIPADLYGNKPKIGARLNMRIRVSDWSALTRFYVCPSEQAGQAHRWIIPVCEVSGVDAEFGQKSGHSATWNGAFRTLQMDGYRKVQVGSPQPWLTDANMTAKYETDGITFTLRTSGACDIYIDRMYSPEWPCGSYVVVGDGAYDTFQSTVIAEFDKRGWHCGVGAFKVADIAGHYTGRGCPTEAQLVSIAKRGHDVFPHYSVPNASFNHTETAFSASDTPATIRSSVVAMINRAAQEHGASARMLQYVQFLQNSGKYNSTDLAAILKKFGAAHGRGPCSDGEFGVDPWHSSMSGTASYRNPEAGNDKSIMAGWIPRRGRFNAGFEQAWFANATADNDVDRARRNTYVGEALELATRRAAVFADGARTYTHYVEEYGTPNRTGSGNPEPSIYNSGADQWRAHLAHLDTEVKAGRLVVLSPSEMYAITYGRSGDVYLRWDGEWVSRSNGQIAF